MLLHPRSQSQAAEDAPRRLAGPSDRATIYRTPNIEAFSRVAPPNMVGSPVAASN